MNFKKMDVDIHGLEFWKGSVEPGEIIRLVDKKTGKNIYPPLTTVSLTKTWPAEEEPISESEMMSLLRAEYMARFDEAFCKAKEDHGEYVTCIEFVTQPPHLNPLEFSKLGEKHKGWYGAMILIWVFMEQGTFKREI